MRMEEKEVIKEEGGGKYSFKCPGCGLFHTVCVATEDSMPPTPIWAFNGDLVKPTISPSVLFVCGQDNTMRCHSFIRDGRIEFLSDCTHRYAGKTLDLVPL